MRVSGTIKKAEEEAIRRAKLSIKRAKRSTNLDARVGDDLPSADDVSSVGDVEDFAGFGNGIEDLDEPGDEDEGSD